MSGILTYAEGTGGQDQHLIWVDRDGKKLAEVSGADAYDDPRISPDGRRFAFSLQSAVQDVWMYDIARGVKTRLTFGSALSQSNSSPAWSPDGRQIAYSSFRGGNFGIYRKASDGSGTEEVLLAANEHTRFLADWSPDDNFLMYYEMQQAFWSIWILPLSGDRTPSVFLKSSFNQVEPRFSADGKWIVYSSTESGRTEVYVVPFPGSGGKWQISTGGGLQPSWRRDGKEIYSVSPDNKLMAAEVKSTDSTFEVGTVRP